MIAWQKRSLEVANLLNPAFLSIVIQQCIKAYNVESKGNAPYVLPFLVSPIVLHKRTRDALPGQISTPFTTWITQLEGSHTKIGYSKRASSVVPYVKEALAFAFANNIIITTEDDGSLRVNKQIRVPTHSNDTVTEEVVMCYKKAYFSGRWLARAGKIETVMALLGVKP